MVKETLLKAFKEDPSRFYHPIGALGGMALCLGSLFFSSARTHLNANYIPGIEAESFIGDLDRNGEADVVIYPVAGERQIFPVLRAPTIQEIEFYRGKESDNKK
ncbi:MAG: hypothetical protein ABIF88_00875 [archaeon]